MGPGQMEGFRHVCLKTRVTIVSNVRWGLSLVHSISRERRLIQKGESCLSMILDYGCWRIISSGDNLISPVSKHCEPLAAEWGPQFRWLAQMDEIQMSHSQLKQYT
ncbi:hypothetical protein TNCV_858801, partial [Trichonephila clavipes]